MSIPTIDLADYTSCDTSLRSQAVATLRGALVEVGFVVVKGHGIDPRLIRKVYALWQRCFVSAERPCRFPPIRAGELLDRRLREIGVKR